MDAKITLSFNADTIALAKEYAKEKGISLSRLTEYIYNKLVTTNDSKIYDLPISSWVMDLASDKPAYHHNPKTRKQTRQAYYEKYEHPDENKAAESAGSYHSKKKTK